MFTVTTSFTQNEANRYAGFNYDPCINTYKTNPLCSAEDPTIKFQVHHNTSTTSLYLKFADELMYKEDITLKIVNFSFMVKNYTGSVTANRSIEGELKYQPYQFINQKQNYLGWNHGYNFNQNEYSRTVTFKVTYQRLPHHGAKSLNHPELLCANLESIRKNYLFSDITVCTVDDTEFPVHKVILAAHSPVFKAMFCNESFEENEKNRIKIDDISGEVMEVLLKYLYSGDTLKVKEFAVELLEAAHLYDIKPLVSECVRQMLRNIQVDNSARLLFYSDLYELDELKAKVIDFICGKIKTVIKSDGWKEYVKIKPELMEQLLERMAEFNANKEKSLFG